MDDTTGTISEQLWVPSLSGRFNIDPMRPCDIFKCLTIHLTWSLNK
jgi:hypothetical protein